MIYKEKFFFWLVVIIGCLLFISAVSEILLPFVVGMLVAYFLDPAADWLESKNVSRTMASVTIIFSFSFVAIMLIVALMPVLYAQLFGLIENIPQYIVLFKEKYHDIYTKITFLLQGELDESAKGAAMDISKVAINVVQDFAAKIVESGAAFINLLSLIFISPVVAFYMLRDYDIMIAKIDGWLPRKNRDTIRKQLMLMDDTLSGFVRGAVNVCILLGVFYGIALSVVGLEYGLLIGFMTGILSFIPYVGMLVGMATGMVVAFFQYDADIVQMAIVLGVFLIGQVLEGNVLTPKLVGDKVGLHAVWIIFGLLAGGVLLGFTGILIAIPVTAILGVLVRFALEAYLQSSYFECKEGGDAPRVIEKEE